MANNRKCLLCGSEYSYCPNCAKDRKRPSWLMSFDKEECKTVFETLSAYNMKLISVSNAKKTIKGIDVNSLNLDTRNKETINEILGVKEVVKPELAPVEPTVEFEAVKAEEETVPEVAEATPSIEEKAIDTPLYPYRKFGKDKVSE